MIDRWIYDVEVFPNLFTCTLAKYDTGEIRSYVIFDTRDDRADLIALFTSKDVRFVGYNNKHYDNVLINYLIKNPQCTTLDLYMLSNSIINDGYDGDWKRYKYPSFPSTDLMLMGFSKKLRVSLKQLQVTMGWPNVMELPIPFDEEVSESDIPEILRYNKNDTLATREFALRKAKDLNLRLAVQRDYGLECMSKDSVMLGVDLLKRLYAQRTGMPEAYLNELRTERPIIDLKECISDKVVFSSRKFNEFLDLLKTIKLQFTKNAFDLTVYYGGVLHRYGTGGIHSDDPAGIVVLGSDHLMIDADVTSLYPSLMIEYEFYPQHLGKEFINVYREIRDKRVKAKRDGDAITSDTLKLSLNGTFGNLINRYSWLYDPKAAMSVTINGQLFISMLSERLTDAKFRVISLNTDGITALVEKGRVDEYKALCRKWEEETGLNLEYNEYEKLVRKDVNNYIAIYKGGGYKLKGFFDYNIELGKGYRHPIVPYALVKYYVDGTPVLETIHNEKDISKFCMTQRADRKFTMEWNGKTVQHTNRFIASKTGAYLYKTDIYKGNKRHIHVLRDSPVALLNDITDTGTQASSYDINYDFYEKQCREVQEVIEPKQLTIQI
jgi:hypothetical protein